MQELEKSNIKENILSKTSVMIFVAMICCLLWGSAFPCIKIGYRLFGIEGNDSVSQIFFAGCRFTIAGMMVIMISSVTNKSFTKPKCPTKIATLAAFQTVIQYLFFYMGLAHTSGVKSSIITGSGTFLTLFVCAIGFRQEKLTTKKVVGSIIGFVGIILVNLGGNNIDFDFSLAGEGFVFIAAFSSAMASGFIKKFSKDADVVMLSGYQFFFGGLIMAVTGFFFGGRLMGITPTGMLLLLYMGFISAAAYTLWGLLLKHNDVSKVSTCKFMNPVFGVILSFILLNERGTLGVNVFVALILVCIGIFIVNYRKK
ncbi:MAG: DMT family transporter [Lachnospiraceae bacterium]|nr:DMT family transporter [Lachnospiraceae bacterium]